MENLGIPEKAIEGVKDSIDCNIYFFDEKVPISTMYVYLAGATVVLAAVYILMNLKKRKIKR